jgi:DNA-3-methyladenine glycosylase II
LSAPKIRALKAIARAVDRGELPLATLADSAADDAHTALTAIHGIGPWTADIYLLACLGHADAWPAGDLALQEAARVAFALPLRPSAKEMLALAEPWRPWRAVAARILWSYYRTATAKRTEQGGVVDTAKKVKPKARVTARPKSRASAGGNRRKTRSAGRQSAHVDDAFSTGGDDFFHSQRLALEFHGRRVEILHFYGQRFVRRRAKFGRIELMTLD